MAKWIPADFCESTDCPNFDGLEEDLLGHRWPICKKNDALVRTGDGKVLCMEEIKIEEKTNG